MEFPDGLRDLNIERSTKDPAWFTKAYEAAVERIQDYTDEGDEHPYWYSELGDISAQPGDNSLRDDMGDDVDLGLAERITFDVLVLVDLARTALR